MIQTGLQVCTHTCTIKEDQAFILQISCLQHKAGIFGAGLGALLYLS